MHRHSRPLAAILLVVTLGTVTPAQDARPVKGRPNLLLLLVDDLTYNAVGSLGELQVQTPNLDRLVHQGVAFTHAYNQGSWTGAVCIASRTMLVTQRYLWHAMAVERQLQPRFVRQQLLWPQLLRTAGYRTYFSGKWHVAADPQDVFDVVRHVRPGMPDQTPEGYGRPVEGKPDPWKPWDTSRGGYWSGGKHWTEVLADDAVDYLHRAKEDDRPFFMYLAFNAPHDPRQAPREFVERYRWQSIRLPASFQPEFPFDIGSNHIRDEQLAPFPRTPYAVKVHRQEYFAIITHLDQQIGRVLEALDAQGLRDTTYIFFTADHGLAVGRHGLMGKQNLFEHSVRMPLVVSGPGVEQDRKSDGPVYMQDIGPTALELAGAAIPDHVEFRSFAPRLRRPELPGRSWIYGGYLAFQRMISDGQWKLIVYPQVGKLQLFHLAEDPEELHDLLDTAEGKSQCARLYAMLLEQQVATDDPVLLPPLERLLSSSGNDTQ